VELLIVMAILVLLVSMVGPRVLGSKQKADINAVKTQIGMLQSALERYAVDMNKFPSTEQGLNALIAKPGEDSASGSADTASSDTASDAETETGDTAESSEEGSEGGSKSNWDGPYLKTETLPKDPWGNSYSYEFPPTHNKINVPDIWSFGPDGQEGTDDDIVSWTGKGKNEESSDDSNSASESRESGA
jgi:general secretion pathway protein G